MGLRQYSKAPQHPPIRSISRLRKVGRLRQQCPLDEPTRRCTELELPEPSVPTYTIKVGQHLLNLSNVRCDELDAEGLLQTDECRAILLSLYFDEFRNGVYVTDPAESSPKSCLFAWLSFVQRSADLIQDD
ncbi:unnamed protein product [Heligmosomoides polygyrus]|uniref:Uncharacterized protein n=1 Tax=Heligmosomoides polygyrus TaxID=6339 RepID=A0A183GKB9_HELPZ|nr:unnamed protein product [Heligmosomoides polygyrus]